MPKKIIVKDVEFFNEETMEFVVIKGGTLMIEHSLISLAKWESKWHKPFLEQDNMTREESIDYIRFMTLNPNVNDDIYSIISDENMDEIKAYLEDPMTASWFPDEKKKKKNSGKAVTAELIYCWMIQLQIPVEFEKWHLNRLMTLIKAINSENAPEKKMSRREIMARNKQLNDARRKRLHSKG